MNIIGVLGIIGILIVFGLLTQQQHNRNVAQSKCEEELPRNQKCIQIWVVDDAAQETGQ